MNTSSASPPTPNLESLRKVIHEYQPNPSRVPFSNLKPFHDSIVALRGKKASYAVIADLLQQNGVKTSRARVAEYGRIVLEGGKTHKRRRHYIKSYYDFRQKALVVEERFLVTIGRMVGVRFAAGWRIYLKYAI